MATYAIGDIQGDVIAGFSSRGGPNQTLGVSKPDITAIGVNVLAMCETLCRTSVRGLVTFAQRRDHERAASHCQAMRELGH